MTPIWISETTSKNVHDIGKLFGENDVTGIFYNEAGTLYPDMYTIFTALKDDGDKQK